MEEEIVVVTDINELLPVECAADPWHRLSALEHDCVLIVEFSELEGPKPALCVPQCPGAHFEANDFAVWLMTADYQMTNHRTSESNFGVDKDIQMMLVNEEQGVYTYAHHFTLFDIEARGFFRPFCAAYLTCDERKLSDLFEILRQEFLVNLERIKNCNRRQFLKELTEAVEALKTVENQAISSYYELYYETKPGFNEDSMTSSLSGTLSSTDNVVKKPEVLNLRYRRLQRELENVHKLVVNFMNGNRKNNRINNNYVTSPACVNHTVNMDPWITTLRKGEGVETRKIMKDFRSLCPCSFDEFCSSMRTLWTKYRHWNRYCTLFLCDNKDPSKNRVNLDSFPLLHLTDDIDSKTHRADVSSVDYMLDPVIGEIDAVQCLSDCGGVADDDDDYSKKEFKLLISLGPKLVHVLYPLLVGQFALIFGCEQRKSTVKALIQKLKLFLPSSDSLSQLCYKWHEGRVPSPVFADFKLFGLHVPKNANLDDFLASNIKSFIAMMDLNSDVLHGAEYNGTIMSCLRSRSLYNFHKNDKTLIPFVFSVISKFALLAFVLYHHVYGFLDSCTSPVNLHNDYSDEHNNSGIHVNRVNHFASTFNVSKKDLKIVKYFVELLKIKRNKRTSFDSIDDPPVDNVLDNMFLDYEPAKILKL